MGLTASCYMGLALSKQLDLKKKKKKKLYQIFLLLLFFIISKQLLVTLHIENQSFTIHDHISGRERISLQSFHVPTISPNKPKDRDTLHLEVLLSFLNCH